MDLNFCTPPWIEGCSAEIHQKCFNRRLRNREQKPWMSFPTLQGPKPSLQATRSSKQKRFLPAWNRTFDLVWRTAVTQHTRLYWTLTNPVRHHVDPSQSAINGTSRKGIHRFAHYTFDNPTWFCIKGLPMYMAWKILVLATTL